MSETLRSLNDLHHLRLVPPCSYVECNDQGALGFAEKVMASQAREFQTGGFLPLVKTTAIGSGLWNISHFRGSRLEWWVISKEW